MIGANKTLRRVAAAYGVTLAPLVSAPLDRPAPGRGVLYEVGSWAEVGAYDCLHAQGIGWIVCVE